MYDMHQRSSPFAKAAIRGYYENLEYNRQFYKQNEDERLKEMTENIPKRALMLERIFDTILSLPKLPTALYMEIAEYEGGVESSVLLGNENENTDTCCTIL